MYKEYNTADEAFKDLYFHIMSAGRETNCGTKSIKNVGFTILNPSNNHITTPFRKWNLEYAQYEWQWYLSGNRNADDIAKRAKIWANMQDEDGNVNSNYGWQWSRGRYLSQLNYVINELSTNPDSRRAAISIYDGKENWSYSKDTPCTMSITFYIEDDLLNMSVHMRSNDLVYGFCNDQYCFSELQKLVAKQLNRQVGQYHHSVVDMHIYERHYDMSQKIK